MRLPAFLGLPPALLVAGCTSLPAPALPPTEAEAAVIVADATAVIATWFAPAHTVFTILSAPRTGPTPIERSMGEALRQRGFGVAAQRAAEVQPIVLQASATAEGTLLLRVDVAETWRASRLYRRTTDGLIPTTAFAIRSEPGMSRRFDAPTPPPLVAGATTGGGPLVYVPPLATAARAGAGTDAETATASIATSAPVAVSADDAPTETADPTSTTDSPAPSPTQPAVAIIAPTIAHVNVGASAATDSARANPTADPDARFNLLEPDAQGVIELDPRWFDRPAEGSGNPFVQVYRPPTAVREVKLTVSATLQGPNPTAIINGRIYNAGETIEGLVVHRIDDETVWLRREPFLLRCAISGTALTLRLP